MVDAGIKQSIKISIASQRRLLRAAYNSRQEHYSFSDEVLLREAKDGTKEKQGTALHNLRVTEDITLLSWMKSSKPTANNIARYSKR